MIPSGSSVDIYMKVLGKKQHIEWFLSFLMIDITTGLADDFQRSDQWSFHEYLRYKWSETCILPDITCTFGVSNI